MILAGVKLSLHALFSGTAQLPDIALEAPGKVICSVTEDSLQAGAIYGAAAMADGLLERMEEELGQPVLPWPPAAWPGSSPPIAAGGSGTTTVCCCGVWP